jgi:hypothetical protein
MHKGGFGQDRNGCEHIDLVVVLGIDASQHVVGQEGGVVPLAGP